MTIATIATMTPVFELRSDPSFSMMMSAMVILRLRLRVLTSLDECRGARCDYSHRFGDIDFLIFFCYNTYYQHANIKKVDTI